MPNITSKELTALEDQLNIEQMLVKKYRSCSNMFTDTVLKSKCEQIASKHQEHYNTLLKYLG